MQLGNELRRLREQAGVVPRQVAELLDSDLSKVSRIETGRRASRSPRSKLAARLLRVEDPAEVDRVRDIRLARHERQEAIPVPPYLRAYVSSKPTPSGSTSSTST